MFVIACGLATKLNKCRCKSRVIFTAAAGILIFTAEVGAYCPRWSARAAAAIEKDLSLYKSVTHLPISICTHTFFTSDPPIEKDFSPYKFVASTAIGWYPHKYSLKGRKAPSKIQNFNVFRCFCNPFYIWSAWVKLPVSLCITQHLLLELFRVLNLFGNC